MTFSSPNNSSCFLSTPGGTISYALRRSRKRRTLQITIKDSLEVSVAAPRSLPQEAIEGFIREKSDWIIRKLAEKRPSYEKLHSRKYSNGEEFLFLGKKYPIQVLPGDIFQSSLVFDNACWSFRIPRLSIPECNHKIKEALTEWYRLQAKEILGTRLFHFSRLTGLSPRKIVIKTQKNLWGSCSSQTKSIQLNWRLVLAPIEVIDYVIVHELSHLEVPNHSRRFWQKVKNILPDYQLHRWWLKANHYDLVLP